MKINICQILAVASFLSVASGVQADVVYDNSATNTGFRLSLANNQEVGDQIILNNGSAPYLTNFSFEYFGNFLSTNVQAEVRFYQNDGAPFNGFGTPGSVIYDSGLFDITQNGTAVLSFDYDLLTTFAAVPLTGIMPGEFTFAITFQGLGIGDEAAIDLFNSPLVGQGYPDYWLNNEGIWQLLTNNATPVNFGSVFEGSASPAPEPAVISLSILSGAALLLAARRRKQ